jgi:serine/threonine protein kinase
MNDHILRDRYQIQQQLGKNTGRRTFLACDLETQQLVVVKLLLFGADFEWEHLKLFEREAQTLKALSHPAIPGYLDYFDIDLPKGKGFALVQTYVEGKSLENHLKAGRTFSESEVKQLAKDILEILIYLHGRQPQVIHRDIKPSNILLTNRSGNSIGQVYLVDFGSVQTLGAKQGGTITVVGTYGYMPPEQFGGRAVPASDLYSLGATLIYLTTGLHPADLPQKDFRIQFEQAANLSPAFASWLKWMTQPSLERRLASPQEAKQALEKPQQAPKDKIYPIVVRKPNGTKVLLKKDADSIEIIIPPRGFGLSVVVWAGLLYLFGSMLVQYAFADGMNPDWFSFFFFLSIVIFIIHQIVVTLFVQIRLRIDPQQMTIAYAMFGLEFKFGSAPQHNICKLVHTNKFYRLTRGAKSTSSSYVQEVPKLVIWAGTKKYELCSEKVLTTPELDWLAYELSDWLNLPISREV